MMRAALIVLTLGLASCAPAQLRLPVGLAEGGTRIDFTGIGGWGRGQFAAGPYSGRFNRSLETFSFEPVKNRTGHGDFVISGPEISSTIEGRCDMRERTLDLGSVEVTVRPMAYRCDFGVEGRPIRARFELQEIVGGGSAITRSERRGEIALGGETVRFRSAHHIAGTSLPSLTPVGYVFERGGQPIGALELTGRPALTLAPGVDPGVARTTTVAALALAILWDPAVHGTSD